MVNLTFIILIQIALPTAVHATSISDKPLEIFALLQNASTGVIPLTGIAGLILVAIGLILSIIIKSLGVKTMQLGVAIIVLGFFIHLVLNKLGPQILSM